jgi:nitrate reductase delta subunit
MELLKLLAVLLDYPDAELLNALAVDTLEMTPATFVDRLDAEGLFAVEERAQVAAFLEGLLATGIDELQQRYVQTFDLTPAHSLHLTHHIFGEEKTRGPALIDLSEIYRAYGLQHDEKELPDYLPLMLEFASGLDADEARVFLGDVAKVLRQLAGNLEEAQSPYAPLLRIVEHYGTLTKLAA